MIAPVFPLEIKLICIHFVSLIVAECGSGKTKIGATALGALQGMHAAQSKRGKTFNLVMAAQT